MSGVLSEADLHAARMAAWRSDNRLERAMSLLDVMHTVASHPDMPELKVQAAFMAWADAYREQQEEALMGHVQTLLARRETATTANLLRWLSETIDGSYPRDLDPEAIAWRRVAKVAEESGEAVQAFAGFLGENLRKGVTHTRDQMVGELLDVALAALSAVEHFAEEGDPPALTLLEKHVVAMACRLATAADRDLPFTTDLASEGQSGPGSILADGSCPK